MHILVTGGTGFIGTRLLPALETAGHRLTVLTRQALADTGSRCHVNSLDQVASDQRLDAVINLAGESMAGRRWSAAYKKTLLDSRLATTAALLALLERLHHRPALLLSASAIGFYGHHGDEILAEDGPVVPGFAQALCARWEAAAAEATALGVRVCLLRLGVVLDRDGGALAEMRRSFDLGVASWFGSGEQWLSWVHREDVVRAIMFLLAREHLVGPFNITAPQPVTARDFARCLAAQRPTLLSLAVPAPIARLLLGEMAEELLLHGQRVVPQALTEAGFSFNYPQLADALAEIMG
jgi:uncharacterized protein (TIGR01777 family)